LEGPQEEWISEELWPDQWADIATEMARLSAQLRDLSSMCDNHKGGLEAGLKNAETERDRFRNALAFLVSTLPKCGLCDRPATKAYERGGRRWCHEHAPEDCPDYPRAAALRIAEGLKGG